MIINFWELNKFWENILPTVIFKFKEIKILETVKNNFEWFI